MCYIFLSANSCSYGFCRGWCGCKEYTSVTEHQIGRLGRQAKTVPGMMIRHRPNCWGKEHEWGALEFCSTALSVEETDNLTSTMQQWRKRKRAPKVQTTKLGTAVTKTNLYALGTKSLLFRVREYAPVVALTCFPSEKNFYSVRFFLAVAVTRWDYSVLQLVL